LVAGGLNRDILKLPEEMMRRGFTLEVLSLYIPELVESDQLVKIAKGLNAVDSGIPYTLLAFFPEYQMKRSRSPDVKEMVEAYRKIKSTGLKHVRLGNLGVFARRPEDQEYLLANVDQGAL
jgi:pyruvate-formate lyase-activating enzyme